MMYSVHLNVKFTLFGWYFVNAIFPGT